MRSTKARPTLAAIVDDINCNRSAHVITIEDPIEYLHRDNLSIINRRDIGVHTQSFAAALRGALRQDPDLAVRRADVRSVDLQSLHPWPGNTRSVLSGGAGGQKEN